MSNRTNPALLEKFKGLVNSLWLSTADRYLSDEEIEQRAEAWARIIPADVFDKYLTYTVRAILLSRTRHGPVHADEFLQVSTKVRNLRLIYSTSDGQWIPESEFIYRYYRATYPGEMIQESPNPSEQTQEDIRKKIYSWT